ncbi:MAG: TonB-dependent receptor [Myxococcales bacterium]|nr:TonB-dependent receptor [Myxococcota bacterium]MDW8283470.1 TonB-dependent receptor [Myxococcales bacterium]
MFATLLVLLGAGQVAAAPTPPRVAQPAPLRYPEDGAGLVVVVRLEVLVDEQGKPAEVQVLGTDPADAPPGFAAAALEHVRALRFVPAQDGGVPVAARVGLTLRIAPPASLPAAASPRAPSPVSPPPSAPAEERFSAVVRGAARQGERAVSDLRIEIGQLRVVPRRSAGELLTLAPGILLTNEGGEGHAQRVFLRGFDAREGQDMEFSVGGVPINEVANAHGQGYADTHFLIPETIASLRVIEGPFDPRQGDFAVAGSAEYRLGVDERGLRLSYRGGSFNSHRVLLLWAPGCTVSRVLCRPGTFGAVELGQSDGFGQNRFSQRAAATAQLDLGLGDWGSLLVLATHYASRFKSPGVVRQDDYEAGRIDFFGSYDLQQGGDATRTTLSARLEARLGSFELMQQAFLTLRNLRLRENFTGFLLDVQRPNQAPRGADPQRGDLLDATTQELTVGGRGAARLRGTLRGLTQQLEVGYLARHDRNQAAQLRLRSGTVVPYRTDFHYAAGQTNIAAYVDLELRPLRWLTLRGGVRGDFFHFDIENRCDQIDSNVPRAPLDVECYSLDRYGYRNPTARRTATGVLLQPRITLQVEPLRGLVLTGSYGHGARSADLLFIGDGDDTPFSSIRAAEGGGLLYRVLGPLELTVRGAFFYTHVDRDLLFNQTLGRNTLAPGTTRLGLLGAGRLLGPWLDLSLSVTWARATFDDTGLLVPYVPEVVVRADGAGFGPLPRLRLLGEPLGLTGGVGLTYVAPRPLPLSERGDPYVLLDTQLRARWHFVELGVMIENLLDRRYRLNEFNYVSDFRSRPYPTLVPERHFIAGPPLTVLASIALHADALLGELRRKR